MPQINEHIFHKANYFHYKSLINKMLRRLPILNSPFQPAIWQMKQL